MQIVERQFLSGPNIWSKQAGLRITCSEVPRAGGSDLDPAVLEAFLAELRQSLPIATESSQLASPDFLLGCDNAAVGLVLALCEIVSRDFCVVPKIGELLSADEGEAHLFVPCDNPPIGLASLRCALAIVNSAPDFTIAEPSEFGRLALGSYLAMRKQGRMYGLDQSKVALVRAAALSVQLRFRRIDVAARDRQRAARAGVLKLEIDHPAALERSGRAG